MDTFSICFEKISEMIDSTKEAFLENKAPGTADTALLVFILWFRAFHKMLEALHKTKFAIKESTGSDFLYIGAVMHLLSKANLLGAFQKDNDVDKREKIVYEQWLNYEHEHFPPPLDDTEAKIIAQGRFDEIVGSLIETHSSRSETALRHTQLVKQLLNFSAYRNALERIAPMTTTVNLLPGAVPPPKMVGGLAKPNTQEVRDALGVGSARNVIRDIKQEEQGNIVRKSIQNIKNVANVANKLSKGKLLKRIKEHSLQDHEFEDFLLDIQRTVKGLGHDNMVVKLIFKKVLQRSNAQKMSGKGRWKDWITEGMIQDFVDMTPDNVTTIGTAAAGFIQGDKLEGLKALASFSIGNIYSMYTSSFTTDEAALRAIFSAVRS